MASSSQEGVTIRYATEEDVPTILLLIRELASYEKELSTVEATVSSLTSTLALGASPVTTAAKPAKCLLLFSPSNEPCGMALYFYNYSTWRSKPGIYLEDLYVRESERGKGYGKRLLRELAKEVVEGELGRLEWSVLKWNTPSIRFYEGIGATAMEGWVGMRVDGEALVKLAGGA